MGKVGHNFAAMSRRGGGSITRPHGQNTHTHMATAKLPTLPATAPADKVADFELKPATEAKRAFNLARSRATAGKLLQADKDWAIYCLRHMTAQVEKWAVYTPPAPEPKAAPAAKGAKGAPAVELPEGMTADVLQQLGALAQAMGLLPTPSTDDSKPPTPPKRKPAAKPRAKRATAAQKTETAQARESLNK